MHKRHPDPQRRAPLARCTRCGGELYAGMSGWRLGGQTLCEDCAPAWVLEELAACRIRFGGEEAWS